MLERLYIENFALIDKLEIDFHLGFNVLTGETGAGKSIIIDAVSVVLGGQGLTEFIRSGQKKALVEAVFNIDGTSKVRSIMTDYGYAVNEGELLILSRELVKAGTNTCRINGRQVNLSTYREITKHLVDIYGQHHQQSLLDAQRHIDLLDAFGGENLLQVKNIVAEDFNSLGDIESKIKVLEANEQEQARLTDYYQFQVEEIDRHHLVMGEDVSLLEEKFLLSNSEKLLELASLGYQSLYEGRAGKSAVDLLYETVNAVREIAVLNENIKPVLESLEASLFQAEEAARDIKKYIQQVDTDPSRLEEIENRLSDINMLKRKYGKTLEEIFRYREESAASIAKFKNFDEELADLKSAYAKQKEKYDKSAVELSLLRKEAAEILKLKLIDELKDLNMPYVSFDVSFKIRTVPGVKGNDEIEFMISPNKGEPLKPLAKIISGGEASRIMLAFRTILAGTDSIATLIFDEIDAGIGGQAVQTVAQKLAAIGNSRQVLCVTHSPQIAGAASFHYNIEKITDDAKTYTKIKELGKNERLDEVARMLNGGTASSAARKHAEEILNQFS